MSYADNDLSGSETPEPIDPEEPVKKSTVMEFLNLVSMFLKITANEVEVKIFCHSTFCNTPIFVKLLTKMH